MKKVTLSTFLIYCIILIVGIFAAIRIISLVVKKGTAYKGNFETPKHIVEDRLYSLSYEYKTGIRGNIYSDENDLMLSTIYIYDLYWFPSEIQDSAKFMQNVDSLISIFREINPRMSVADYTLLIKENYLNYKQKYRKSFAKTKSEDKNIQKEGHNELKSLKSQFKIIKISKATKASEWVTQDHWDKICSLFPSKSNSHGGCKVDKRLIHNNVYKNCASATIGNLNIKNSSKFTDSIIYDKGIEGFYDDLLAEERLVSQRLYVNKVLVPLRENRKVTPKNGVDLITTINIDIQRITENALQDQLEKIEASWGCAIVMEVKTGEIKAISNLTKVSEGVFEETIDHAITEAYEPGSTFKLITLLAALESGKIDTSSMVKCEENRIFTLKRAFEISDNDGLYNAAKISYSNLYDYYKAILNMSLQKDLNLEVTKAQIPVLISKTQREIDFVNVTHGYSIKLPPIYMLAYFNAIANNGKYIQPILVKQIRYPNNRVKDKLAAVINPRICSRSTIAKVQACLESVVTHGTGIRARDENYKNALRDTTIKARPLIAGKTGTAFIFDDKERKYSTEIKNSSFIGYFPSEMPKYTCLVLISGTRSDGGYVAAPVCKEIAEKIINRDNEIAWSQTYKGIMANAPTARFGYANDFITILKELGYNINNKTNKTDWVEVQQVEKGGNLIFNRKNIKKEYLANQLRGANAKDAVYLLEKNGYAVQLKGIGKVYSIIFSENTAIIELKN